MVTKVDEIMALVDNLISAVKKLQRATDEGSDAEYEAADIAADRARADVNDALLAALPDNAEMTTADPVVDCPVTGITGGARNG